MYIQPKSEITDVASRHALCGSVLINTNDQYNGVGGQAPKRRRTPVF